MTRHFGIKSMVALSAVLLGGAARAGVPFINLEGAGGVAFNPLAYAATDGSEGIKAGVLEIARPRIGLWYVGLTQSSIDWTTVGVATSINNRLEISFGYESIAINGFLNLHDTSHKKNVGGKLVVLDENAFGTKFLPQVAIGTMWKSTEFHPLTPDGSGVDFYAVATKMVTQLPVPLLLSAGALSTQAMVDGVIGFNSQRKIVAFANVDVVPLSFLALGAEYRMGPDYGAAGGGYIDGDYFNVHAGWFVTKGFTLVAAYAYPSKKTDATRTLSASNPIGFGSGFVLAGQYAF